MHTYEKILQAIGQASVSCVGSDGIFDTNKAVAISKQLYLDITGIAPPDIKELAATDIQQLKAEIAEIVNNLDRVSHSSNFKYVYESSLERLRQLSAV